MFFYFFCDIIGLFIVNPNAGDEYMRVLKRLLALFFAVLMAVPFWAGRPVEVLAGSVGAAMVARVPRFEFNSNTLNHVPGQFPPGPALPPNLPNTFAFDVNLAAMAPGERLYAIFPFDTGQVIRVDIWRVNPHPFPVLNLAGTPTDLAWEEFSAHFMLSSHPTIAQARLFDGDENNAGINGYAVFNLLGGGYAEMFPERVWPEDATAHPRFLSELFPSVVLGPTEPGFSFQIRRGTGDAFDLTTFHVLREGNLLTFGINALGQNPYALLQAGRLYTFEFGRALASGLAQDPQPLFYHLMTDIDMSRMIARPFSQDYVLAPGPGLVYTPPDIRWYAGRDSAAIWDMPHFHLYPDDSADETVWYENWHHTQRVAVTVPLPFAWHDDPTGTVTSDFATNILTLRDGWGVTGFTGAPIGRPDNAILIDMHIDFDLFRLGGGMDSTLRIGNIFTAANSIVPGFGGPGTPSHFFNVTGGFLPIVRDPLQQITPRPPTQGHNVGYNPENNTMTVVLDDLDGSRVFNHAQVVTTIPGPIMNIPGMPNVLSMPVDISRSTHVPRNRLFTFAHYTYPEFIDDRYVVRVTPYREATVNRLQPGPVINGIFTIYAFRDSYYLGINPLTILMPPAAPILQDPPDTVSVFDNPNPVELPIAWVDVDLPPRVYYRIVFFPDVGGGFLETRPFRLLPRETDIRIGSPWGFRIRSHDMLPLPPSGGHPPLTESDLILHLEWSIASFDLLRNQLLRRYDENVALRYPDGPGGPLITMPIRYDLNNMIGLETPRPFGVVELVIGLFQDNITGEFYIEIVDFDSFPVPEFPDSEFRVLGDTLREQQLGLYPRLIVGTNVTVQLSAEIRAERVGTGFGHPFNYPNIFLLSVSTSLYQPANIDPQRSYVAYDRRSGTDILVLDDFARPRIVPPQGFELREQEGTFTPETGVTLETRFIAPYRELRTFIEQQYTLHPGNFHVNPPTMEGTRFVPVPTFTLFLTQNPDLLMQFGEELAEFNREFEENPFVTPPTLPGHPNVWYFEARRGAPLDTAFDISDQTLLGTNNTGQLKTMLDVLRDGGIVAIVDFPRSEADMFNAGVWATGLDAGHTFANYPGGINFYNLLGFDLNQRYYGAMMTLVSFHYPGRSPLPTENRDDIIRFRSDLTEIIALTTSGEHMPIDPDELPPDRPIWRRPVDQDLITDRSATLFFSAVEEYETNYFVRYEIIRTQTRIETSFLNLTTVPFSDFFRDFTDPWDPGRAGFRWSQDTGAPQRYESPGMWANPIMARWNIERLELEGGRWVYQFDDDPILPNNIYFYYVRSVRVREFRDADGVVINTEEVNFSIWDEISITTEPISAPRNLRVVRDEPSFPFNAHTEVVLRFEIPQASVHFHRQLELREGDGDWVSHPYWQLMHESMPGEDGYVTVTYLVHFLRPSTDYSFRVRLIDQHGHPSLWSNTAFARTDFGQDDFDDTRHLHFWLEFMRRYLRIDFDRNYWPLDVTDHHAFILYRHSMVDNVIWDAVGSRIYIYTQNVNRLEVLLPVALIEAANSNNGALIIRNGNLETVIPAGAFTPAMTGAREAIQQTITGPANDYYIMVSIDYTTLFQNPVDSHALGERRADIRVQAISSRMTARQLDNDISWQVHYMIDSDATFADAAPVILSMLRQNLPNTEIALFVYGFMEQVRRSIMAEAQQMYAAQVHLTHNVTQFSRPISHALLTGDDWDIIAGFVAHERGYLARAQTNSYRNGAAVSLPGPAAVLFTVHNAFGALPGLVYEVVLPGYAATVIARHSLTDIVGSDMNAAATLSVFANSIARIAGAPHGTDGIAFLREQGYTITGRTSASLINWQEAAYLMMALYEMRTGVSAASMQIRNLALTAGIAGIDQRYLQSVRAAFELGILTDPAMNPNDVVTIMDMLNMISRMNSRLGL